MAMTWEAIFEQWPWFAAAAAVLVIVVGLLFLLKPKSMRHLNAAGSTVHNKGWVLTGRIDFVDRFQTESLCFKSRRPRLLIVQAAWSIAKSVGEWQH
jgi:hypothetical protein